MYARESYPEKTEPFVCIEMQVERKLWYLIIRLCGPTLNSHSYSKSNHPYHIYNV